VTCPRHVVRLTSALQNCIKRTGLTKEERHPSSIAAQNHAGKKERFAALIKIVARKRRASRRHPLLSRTAKCCHHREPAPSSRAPPLQRTGNAPPPREPGRSALAGQEAVNPSGPLCLMDAFSSLVSHVHLMQFGEQM
jgi:hypothetical protein